MRTPGAFHQQRQRQFTHGKVDAGRVARMAPPPVLDGRKFKTEDEIKKAINSFFKVQPIPLKERDQKAARELTTTGGCV
ncbi:hypothetical protein OESDEN_19132, partial [Oesophagostomum dentatum]